MADFKGAIIEESLENKEVIKKIKIISTRVEKVTEEHETPWLLQWTIHNVELPESEAQNIAQELSKSLDHNHGGSWYADFKNNTHHYIIFRNKIFYIDRAKKEQYDEAEKYGLSLGIPEHQLINYEEEYKDIVPEIKK